MKKRIAGFTLIELLLVIILISIFATVAVWRQPQTDGTVQACAGVLRAHIRYCQMRAMNTNSVWGIQFRGGKYGLVMVAEDNSTTGYLLPGETEQEVDLVNKGVAVSPADFLLKFDGWGAPVITEDSKTFSLSKKDSTVLNITVNAKTGLVQ